jgi:hypothetical protein
MASWWWQRWRDTATDRTPLARMLPSVIGGPAWDRDRVLMPGGYRIGCVAGLRCGESPAPLQLTYVKALIALHTIVDMRTGRGASLGLRHKPSDDRPDGGRSARLNGGIERCRLRTSP